MRIENYDDDFDGYPSYPENFVDEDEEHPDFTVTLPKLKKLENLSFEFSHSQYDTEIKYTPISLKEWFPELTSLSLRGNNVAPLFEVIFI